MQGFCILTFKRELLSLKENIPASTSRQIKPRSCLGQRICFAKWIFKPHTQKLNPFDNIAVEYTLSYLFRMALTNFVVFSPRNNISVYKLCVIYTSSCKKNWFEHGMIALARLLCSMHVIMSLRSISFCGI